MSLSFAIIGPRDSQNTTDLHDFVTKNQNTCKIYSIRDITIGPAEPHSQEFFTHDIYIFRGYNRSIPFARSLATTLHERKKVVIDEILTTATLRTKLEEMTLLDTAGISHPRTYYAQSIEQWKIILKDKTFPLIIKSIDGQKGQDVHKFDTFDDAINFLTQNETRFIAQDFIKSDGDIRVFIVGDKIVGAIKRMLVQDDFRSNASLGAQSISYDITEDITQIAMRAHRAIGYDISGVDIIISENGNPYVLEINHTPQWQALKNASGTNPAEEIVKYSIKKYEEKNRIL